MSHKKQSGNKQKIAVRPRIATQTKIALLLAAGFAAAAGIGYVGMKTPYGQSVRDKVGTFVRNAGVPVGYYVPGYYFPGNGLPVGSPGYLPAGYVPGGYRPGGVAAGMSLNCQKDGWTVSREVVALRNVHRSRPIKGSGAALYWFGKDEKRYVFPNEKTYRTWYPFGSRCLTVYQISDADLAKISIGGNVRYKPLTQMIKVTADPKVYLVTRGGILHHMESESVAQQAYGAGWASRVSDVPDGFFVNYTVGTSVKTLDDFNTLKREGAFTIDQDLGL